MQRRTFLGTLASGLLAGPLAAEAQPAGKVYRVGVLGANMNPVFDVFKQGLSELGYNEGRNLVLEFRWFEGKTDRLSP